MLDSFISLTLPFASNPLQAYLTYLLTEFLGNAAAAIADSNNAPFGPLIKPTWELQEEVDQWTGHVTGVARGSGLAWRRGIDQPAT